MKEIDNEKANATRDNMYTIYIYIEHDTCKPTMREKRIDKYANAQTASARNRVLEKARTRTLCFKYVH